MPTRKEGQQDRAARLVALDYETDRAIARKVGITKTTLERWKRDPAFAALVITHRDEQHAAAMSMGVADKTHRVGVLDDMKRRLLQVIEERAEDPSMAEIPGGTTGLVVRQAKLVKVYKSDAGPTADGAADADDADDAEDVEEDGETLTPTKQVEVVFEYSVDTGTVAELRNVTKQLAQEMGEWVEKKEHSGKVRVESGPDLSLLTDEELDELKRLAKRLEGAGGDRAGGDAPPMPA